MSLVLRLAIVTAVTAWVVPAWAQSEGQGADRFFAEKAEDDDADEDATLVSGSLTSTTFAYRETASIAVPLAGNAVGVENASEFDRVFTDMRALLDARHIKGSSWDFHGDARVRVAPTARVDSNRSDEVVIPVQASVFGDNEYQVRELYLRKFGASADYTIGRQHVLELAAHRVDGIRVDYAKDDNWTYLGFAGLHPDRSSRSVLDDYPRAAPEMIGGEPGSRILPVTAGGGAAYRFQKYYGSLGLVGILPMADERLVGAPRAEQPRIFASSSGYYRRSPKLDVYHFAVVDLYGSNVSDREELEGTIASIPLTNLSVGVNYRPNTALRLTGSINRVDTETLNVIAQTRLEDPAPGLGFVQNNIEVQRISQQSARVGISGAFKENRFEVSIDGMVRSRPEIQLVQGDEQVTVPSAQAFEVGLRLLDRRSIKDHRLLAGYTRINGFGETNFYRTDSDLFRVGASREFKEGLGEYEIDVSYIRSADSGRGGTACPAVGGLDPFADCFGSSAINTVAVGGMVFYRPKRDWLVLGGLNVASQAITIIDNMVETPQPSILILTGHVRISYRF